MNIDIILKRKLKKLKELNVIDFGSFENIVYVLYNEDDIDSIKEELDGFSHCFDEKVGHLFKIQNEEVEDVRVIAKHNMSDLFDLVIQEYK